MLGTWAEAAVSASTAGKASLRLRTCGGAVLFVNGAEAGWMAPYGRNLEAQQEFEVALVAGVNEIRIWFDDLAERDARYFFQLDYARRPGGRACDADFGGGCDRRRDGGSPGGHALRAPGLWRRRGGAGHGCSCAGRRWT